VRRPTLADSVVRHDPGLPGPPQRRAYGMMIGFPLFAVIALIVDWSRFRWA
jgi:hypothetical protein